MIRLLTAVVALVLTSCTASQLSQAEQVCHTATAAESVNPSLVAHNGKIIAGQTQLCAAVSAIQAQTPAQ